MVGCTYVTNKFGFESGANGSRLSVPSEECIEEWEEYYVKGIKKQYEDHTTEQPLGGVPYTNYTPAGTRAEPDLMAIFSQRPSHTARKIMFASTAVLFIIALLIFIIIHRRETASVLRATQAGVHPRRIKQKKT